MTCMEEAFKLHLVIVYCFRIKHLGALDVKKIVYRRLKSEVILFLILRILIWRSLSANPHFNIATKNRQKRFL